MRRRWRRPPPTGGYVGNQDFCTVTPARCRLADMSNVSLLTPSSQYQCHLTKVLDHWALTRSSVTRGGVRMPEQWAFVGVRCCRRKCPHVDRVGVKYLTVAGMAGRQNPLPARKAPQMERYCGEAGLLRPKG